MSAQLQCVKCQTIAGRAGNRLPNGWKRKSTLEALCADCWGKQHILRAVTLPIASPGDAGTWQDLRAVLKTMWQQTTAASNYVMTALLAKDVRRQPGESRMPPMPAVYLYPEIRRLFTQLPSQAAAALEHSVTRKYKAKRYEVIWTCASSLPTFRYPQPFPVHNQSWTPAIVDEKPTVSVRIGDRRWTLRLRSGPRFRRQLEAFRMLCTGDAIRGELALFQRKEDLMCKMIAWLPRPQISTDLQGVLLVRSTGESLLVACNEKNEMLWSYHADHIRRWAAEHRRMLHRWSQDQHTEGCPVASFADRRQKASAKYRLRIDTACDQAAAFLANFARRRKFAEVRYDDSDHSFLPEFVWHRLKSRIEMVLDERGIVFTHAGPTATTAAHAD